MKNILLVGFSVAPPEWRDKLNAIREGFKAIPDVEVRKGSVPKDWAWATVRWAPSSPAQDKHTAHLPQDLEKVRELYRRLKGGQPLTLKDVKFPTEQASQPNACPKCKGTGKHSWVSDYTKKEVTGKCYDCKGKGIL
jgi:hypothetical protein